MRNKSTQQMLLLVSLSSLTMFLFVTLSKSSFATFDENVSSWATSIQTEFFTPVAEAIDFAASTPALFAATLSVAAALFYKSYRRYSVLFMGSMLGNAIVVAAIKVNIQSVRPFDELPFERGFSFPSGHTTGSVVFWGLLLWFAWKHLRNPNVKVFTTLFSVFVMSVVGFDRIYLNVHWFSDVLGGYILGVLWLSISILVFQYLEHSTIWSRISQRKVLKPSKEGLNRATRSNL